MKYIRIMRVEKKISLGGEARILMRSGSSIHSVTSINDEGLLLGSVEEMIRKNLLLNENIKKGPLFYRRPFCITENMNPSPGIKPVPAQYIISSFITRFFQQPERFYSC